VSRTPLFNPGAVVVLRSVRSFAGRPPAVGFSVAGTVLVDQEDLSVVATTPGSDIRRRAGRGSGPRGRLVLGADWDGTHIEATWTGSTVVRVHRTNEPWSVWRWHDGIDWLARWYVNLETPWRRVPVGFDTQDWTLDVTVDASDGGWSVAYKDLDELAYLTSVGECPPQQADRIRRVGERAAAMATARAWPFDADWSAWAPRDTTPARLPDGWNLLIA